MYFKLLFITAVCFPPYSVFLLAQQCMQNILVLLVNQSIYKNFSPEPLTRLQYCRLLAQATQGIKLQQALYINSESVIGLANVAHGFEKCKPYSALSRFDESDVLQMQLSDLLSVYVHVMGRMVIQQPHSRVSHAQSWKSHGTLKSICMENVMILLICNKNGNYFLFKYI